MQTIGYLGPEEQTYGWHVAKSLVEKMGICAEIIPEENQPNMLQAIMDNQSKHAACVAAFSNNLGMYSVPEVGQLIKRYTRTDPGGKQRLEPNQLIAIARTGIEQCLIGKEKLESYGGVKKIYAHPEAAKQTSSWVHDNIGKDLIEFCDSNGQAINKALDNNNPDILAIGPAFAINDDAQEVLERGIDNNECSETSFALITRPDNPLILPREYRHDGKYGAMLYAKVDQLGDSQFPLALQLFGVERYANRSTNSPASGIPVIGKDVMADSPKALCDLIDGLNEGLPGLRITASMGEREIILEGGKGILEHNYLGPCQVLQV